MMVNSNHVPSVGTPLGNIIINLSMIIMKYSDMIWPSEQIQYETMVFGCFCFHLGEWDKWEDIENFPSTMGIQPMGFSCGIGEFWDIIQAVSMGLNLESPIAVSMGINYCGLNQQTTGSNFLNQEQCSFDHVDYLLGDPVRAIVQIYSRSTLMFVFGSISRNQTTLEMNGHKTYSYQECK